MPAGNARFASDDGMLVAARSDNEAGIFGAKFQRRLQNIIATAEDNLWEGVRGVAAEFARAFDRGGESGHWGVGTAA
jgi:hypothetical protein